MKIEFDEDTRIGIVISLRPDNNIELIAHTPSSFEVAEVEAVVRSLLSAVLELGHAGSVQRVEIPPRKSTH